MRPWLLLLLPLWLSLAAAAPTVLITDLSQGRIDINTRFKGADLLVFGAIQYPAGAVPDAPADIAIVVRGPASPVTVREKQRVAGIWLNTDAVRFESVPGFYAVATTRPIDALADDRTTAIYEIGVNNLQLSPASATSAADINRFEAGLIRVKRDAGLFVETPGAVVVTRNVLYRARIAIPAAVPVGDYAAEIHLIRKGRVIASSTTPIVIGKSGFERWVYVMAHEHSLAYGLAAVAAALIAGGIASAVTRRR
ncbi:TIGR02186 family protein [Polymorphobacter fuscus]|uniref:TIGR02186 family protein n=1 Tax=Sandarakinorhabdus fusca TaxID=1439888 RepID=A0A7C9GSQ5_9SPHN|nr:TIGR02186 family protein [Polymorphobacter fuscus]KAB7645653.1 hypothetical protein F9290_12370 [Polymorphobacter fuscus]MQT18051.1 hypothetical protein [Polymorphobacter fuscus]NJC08684.1 uncharacterized protein (TIGR02186 family) [Polymorphobacter fuscus]